MLTIEQSEFDQYTLVASKAIEVGVWPRESLVGSGLSSPIGGTV
jgi:hypothetical protein